eukprot:jgi/Ulvmu1/7057/UM033_0117.1
MTCGGCDLEESTAVVCNIGESRWALERAYCQADPPALAESFMELPSHQFSGQISETEQHLLELVFPVQLSGPPGPPKSKDKKEDFYANVGDAIRTLREDVPTCLKDDINYDIYRDDIVFRDPRNSFSGIKNYKIIFWSLRFHGKLFFKELYVEVKRIWQKDDHTIYLRWTVHGFPRLPWDQEGTFDGVSTYKLDCHGKIYEHKIDNIILSDPPMQRVPYLVRLSLSPVSQPYPSPCASSNNPQ